VTIRTALLILDKDTELHGMMGKARRSFAESGVVQ